MRVEISDKEKELLLHWIDYSLREGMYDCDRPEEYAQETLAAISLAAKIAPDFKWGRGIFAEALDIEATKNQFLYLMERALKESQEDEDEYFIGLAQNAIEKYNELFEEGSET